MGTDVYADGRTQRTGPPSGFYGFTDARIWRACVSQEPRLEDLRRAAGWFAGNRDGFCAVSIWATVLKPRLETLVGWFREPRGSDPGDKWDELIRSARAYEVCYGKVAEYLPECCHDGDCGMREPTRIGSTAGQIRKGTRL